MNNNGITGPQITSWPILGILTGLVELEISTIEQGWFCMLFSLVYNQILSWKHSTPHFTPPLIDLDCPCRITEKVRHFIVHDIYILLLPIPTDSSWIMNSRYLLKSTTKNHYSTFLLVIKIYVHYNWRKNINMIYFSL